MWLALYSYIRLLFQKHCKGCFLSNPVMSPAANYTDSTEKAIKELRLWHFKQCFKGKVCHIWRFLGGNSKWLHFRLQYCHSSPLRYAVTSRSNVSKWTTVTCEHKPEAESHRDLKSYLVVSKQWMIFFPPNLLSITTQAALQHSRTLCVSGRRGGIGPPSAPLTPTPFVEVAEWDDAAHHSLEEKTEKGRRV